MRLVWFSMLLLLPLFAAAAPAAPEFPRYAALLKRHACPEGVDYPRLKASGLLDSAERDFRLDSAGWTALNAPGRLAYAINLYNFRTLRLVAENHPLKSIRDLKDPWARPIVPFLGSRISLDHLEHKVIRKEFPEPRIHFALNCASRGCPPLSGEPYRGRDLERQLAQVTAEFLRDTTRNRVEAGHFRLSRIFEWYGDDFKGQGGVEAFVRRELKAGPGKISYLEYDWGLNQASCLRP